MSLLLLLAGSRKESLPYTIPTSAPYNVPVWAPTPTADGTGEVIHPDVIDFGPDGWSGHRYWMAITGFYQAIEPLENPHILVSDDGWHFSPPDGLTNPIDPWPGEATNNAKWYNSDTDLVYDPDADRLICYYREVPQSTTGSQLMRARTSADGSMWSDEIALFDAHRDVDGGFFSTSPAVVRVSSGEWRMYLASGGLSDSASDRNRFLTAPTALGPWDNETFTKINWARGDGTPGPTPYHGDVILHGGRYFAIFQRGGSEYPAISDDGINFTVKDRVLWAATLRGVTQGQYRATLQVDPVDPSVMQVWYQAQSGTVRESWWGRRVCYTRIPLSAWTG